MSIRDTYAEQAWEFALPSARNVEYLSLGLWGEVGELASLVAKSIRDETELDKTAVAKELGDVMWFIAGSAMYNDNGRTFGVLVDETAVSEVSYDGYSTTEAVSEFISSVIDGDLSEVFDSAAELARIFGYTLDEVLEMNLAKLQSRRDRGKITGSGDDR